MTGSNIEEGQLLWTPGPGRIADSNVHHYLDWLRIHGVADLSDYQALWEWSVEDIDRFWASLWQYFEIVSTTPYQSVRSSKRFDPDCRWFTGAEVNYAEHILRNADSERVAFYHSSETRPLQSTTWRELASQVRKLATSMRSSGLVAGDQVCCVMPNLIETVVAMLATISIGCVWANAAPEFGSKAIIERFAPLRPKWIFLADGYQFAGSTYDRTPVNASLVTALSDSLSQVVFLSYTGSAPIPEGALYVQYEELLQGEDPGLENFRFARVGVEHPLWVVFSSGTTGAPKAIVHNHAGALMGMYKDFHFHLDLKPGDTSFFYTTTGWVMFNMQVGMLLTGCTGVLYDGSPVYPSAGVLWQMVEKCRITMFGASPGYVQAIQGSMLQPAEAFDLSSMGGVLLGGAPASPEVFEWLYSHIKKDLWVTSQSGGTEIVGGFVGAIPTQPVYAGEIQTRMLGMDVEVWNEQGEPRLNEVGELVCKQPFPSMPLRFMNDAQGSRYRESYFDDFPGIWRHGDLAKFNDRGGCYIYGRSDSTLNRYGVRIGTAELYRVVEALPEVEDSLVVCIELPKGQYFMPMFLTLAEGIILDQHLDTKLRGLLREQGSPRHVPDKFYTVKQVPYTLTGKKMEVPVQRLLSGWPIEKVASTETMKNPAALEFFVDYVKRAPDYSIPVPRLNA